MGHLGANSSKIKSPPDSRFIGSAAIWGKGQGDELLPLKELKPQVCLGTHTDTVAASGAFNEEEHMRILLMFGYHL